MLSRKRRILLIIFLTFCSFIFVQESIRQYNGDVRAPWLLKQAVEVVLLVMPEKDPSQSGYCCMPIFPNTFGLALLFHITPTSKLIPFLAHRSEDVRDQAHSELRHRHKNGTSVFEQAYRNGSARIKLELNSITNRGISIEERTSLLKEIIENPKHRVFRVDGRRITKYQTDSKSMNVDDYPFDVIKLFLKMMETDNIYQKNYAIDSLGKFGDGAASSVPTLIEILKGKNANIHRSKMFLNFPFEQETLHGVVITTLGDIGPSAYDAYPLLEEKLIKCNYAEEINIRTSLHLIGKDPEKHLAFLLNEFNTKTSDKSQRIILTNIARIKTCSAETMQKLISLASQLGEEQRINRHYAGYAISKIEGSHTTENRILIELANHKNVEYRLDAIQDMRMNFYEPEIKDTLLEFLNDDNYDVRFGAMDIFYGHLTKEDEKKAIVRSLVEIANAVPITTHTQNAANKLRNYEDIYRSDALPGLYRLLTNSLDKKFFQNRNLILSLGGDENKITEMLYEIALSEDPIKSPMANKLLGDIKLANISSLPTLCLAIHSENEVIKESAEYSINSIVRLMDDDAEIPSDILLEILSCIGRDEMKKVVQIAIDQNTDNRDISIKLAQTATLKQSKYEYHNMKMLESFGDEAVAALPILISRYYGCCNYQGNNTILAILTSVTSKTEASVDDILPVFYTLNPEISLEAVSAIKRLIGDCEPAVEKLIEVATNGTHQQIRLAIQTLRTVGPEATSALPLLKQYSKDEHALFAREALSAIANIEQSTERMENGGNNLTK